MFQNDVREWAVKKFVHHSFIFRSFRSSFVHDSFNIHLGFLRLYPEWCHRYMRIYLETVSMHMYLYSLIYLHMQNGKFHMQSIFKYLSATTIPNHINDRKREQMLMLFAPRNNCRKKSKIKKKKYRCNRIFDRNSDRYSFFDFSPQIKV